MTGKTGGGRGTNQYRIRGRSVTTPTSADDVNLSVAAPASAWDDLLREYPSPPDDVHAIPEPAWDDLNDIVASIEPKGTERAVARYKHRESKALYADSKLEGLAFTEPEIVTLINGGHVAGHTEGEEAQVAGLKRASDLMLAFVEDGAPINPSQTLSDDLHRPIALPLGLKSIEFRGDQREQYFGPQVRLDRGETFRALDARLTHAVFDAGLERVLAIEHPVLRGVTWAAFATYEQFYLDGNKRTGRYVMNTVLMSHGFDAITIPDRLKPEYEDALVDAYRTGNLTPHIRFLLSLYDDH